MKTLREFYDGLNSISRIWINNHCNEWFDAEQPDCYRKRNSNETADAVIQKYIDTLPEKGRYCSPDREKLAATLIKLARSVNAKNTDELIEQYLEVYDNSYVSSEIFANVSKENQDKIFERLHGCYFDANSGSRIYEPDDPCNANRPMIVKFHLQNYLYTVKDFDNLDTTKVLYSGSVPLDILQDIFKEKTAEFLKDSPDAFTPTMVKYGEMSDTFDQLFFCKDGWNEDKRRIALRSLYTDNMMRREGEHNQKVIKDFIERIVAVDHSYLRYIHTLIGEDLGSAMKYIMQKKDDGSNEFLYSKDVRKLMKLSWICHRKSCKFERINTFA